MSALFISYSKFYPMGKNLGGHTPYILTDLPALDKLAKMWLKCAIIFL